MWNYVNTFRMSSQIVEFWGLKIMNLKSYCLFLSHLTFKPIPFLYRANQ
jgi:hypothetical protein